MVTNKFQFTPRKVDPVGSELTWQDNSTYGGEGDLWKSTGATRSVANSGLFDFGAHNQYQYQRPTNYQDIYKAQKEATPGSTEYTRQYYDYLTGQQQDKAGAAQQSQQSYLKQLQDMITGQQTTQQAAETTATSAMQKYLQDLQSQYETGRTDLGSQIGDVASRTGGAQTAFDAYIKGMPQQAASTYSQLLQNPNIGIPQELQQKMLADISKGVTTEAQKYGILQSGSTIGGLEDAATQIALQDYMSRSGLAQSLLGSQLGLQSTNLQNQLGISPAEKLQLAYQESQGAPSSAQSAMANFLGGQLGTAQGRADTSSQNLAKLLSGQEARQYGIAQTAEDRATALQLENIARDYEKAVADEDYERAEKLNQQVLELQKRKSQTGGIGGALGGLAGFFLGGPAGATAGAQIGSGIGQAFG